MLALKLSLEQLQEKLQLLIKQYGVLDKENQQLKAAVTKQENKNKELLEQLNASKHQLTASRMHQSEMNVNTIFISSLYRLYNRRYLHEIRSGSSN